MAITPVANISAPGMTPGSGLVQQTPAKAKGEFTQLFKDLVQSANKQHAAADQSIQQFIDGENSDIQNVAMTMAKADLSFRLVLEIRNKLMDAYQEIMRMQV